MLLACEQKESFTTIYLVRHAEKDTLFKGDNPPLIEKGLQRAERLKDILKGEGIQRIYSTKFERNINTVSPLSQELNIEVQRYDYYNYHSRMDELKNARLTALICGHGDNLLPIIKYLNGKSPVESLGHNAYDNLFKLRISADTTFVEVIKF